MYTFFRWFGLLSGFPLWAFFFKKKVYYEDKAVQNRFVKGGALVISNHYSALDYLLCILLFPFRQLHVVLSEQMFRKSKFFHWNAKIYGGICSERDVMGMRFIDESIAVLEKGKLLQIFPEAHITTDGKMHDFKTSYLLIALRAGVPLLPVMVDGNYGFTKRAHLLIGKPIDLNEFDLPLNPSREELTALNREIQARCFALREELDRRIAAEKRGKGNALAHQTDNNKETLS